jgi:hypothetical protein
MNTHYPQSSRGSKTNHIIDVEFCIPGGEDGISQAVQHVVNLVTPLHLSPDVVERLKTKVGGMLAAGVRDETQDQEYWIHVYASTKDRRIIEDQIEEQTKTKDTCWGMFFVNHLAIRTPESKPRHTLEIRLYSEAV